MAEADPAGEPGSAPPGAANGGAPDAPDSTPIPPGAGDTPRPIDSDDGDACGASKLQSLVGKPRSAVPDDLPPRTRVTCTTCPVTMDFSPNRLNILYDERTEVIEEVRCG